MAPHAAAAAGKRRPAAAGPSCACLPLLRPQQPLHASDATMRPGPVLLAALLGVAAVAAAAPVPLSPWAVGTAQAFNSSGWKVSRGRLGALQGRMHAGAALSGAVATRRGPPRPVDGSLGAGRASAGACCPDRCRLQRRTSGSCRLAQRCRSPSHRSLRRMPPRPATAQRCGPTPAASQQPGATTGRASTPQLSTWAARLSTLLP